MKAKRNTGLAIHIHHNFLVDHCYDYAKRVRVIKTEKPEEEQAIRLRLFRLLTPAAIKDLPPPLIDAYAAWNRAYAVRNKADTAWKPKARAAWHAKWCGCKEWNGEEIVFGKGK